MQTFHVSEPYYSQLKRGLKKIEVRSNFSRLATETRVGEKIELFTTPKGAPNTYEARTESFVALVVSKDSYPGIQELLTNNNLSDILPGVVGVEEGTNIYVPKFITSLDVPVCAVVLQAP